MDWSRAKTIFIITFLILDIFLIYQMINQKSENTFDLISNPTIDELLVADEIIIPELSDEEPTKEMYVEANQKQFIEGELVHLANQDINYITDSLIHSMLKAPFSLGDPIDQQKATEFINSTVYEGNQYKFWKMDEEKNTITFYQVYNEKMFYQNAGGRLVLNLNDENEVISYTQTILDNVKEVKEQEILSAYEAIVILYNKHHIKTGSEITNVEIGYRTLVPIQTLQLLAPTWRITINDSEDFYVNAVEGHIFQVNDETNSLLE